MLSNIIGGAIGTVGTLAGAVLGGGEQEQGQNEQGNDEARSATQLASDANVLRPSFVLSQSNAERIRREEEGSRNNTSNELGVNEDPSTEEEEEEDDDDEKEERKQAPHPLFDTSADKMPYAPGQQQQILGNRTLDRLQLPVADSTSSSYQGPSLSEIDSQASTETTVQPTSSSEEATANSFVSGLSNLTNSSGGSDDDSGLPTISPAGATGSRNSSNETSGASPSRWECLD